MDEDDVRNHIDNEILYLIYHPNEYLPVGFASFNSHKVLHRKVLYLEGIAIKRKYQKKGLFHHINNTEIERLLSHNDFFALDTQNPVVYDATKKLCGSILNESKSKHEKYGVGVASILAHLKYGSNLEENIIARKLYGRKLHDKIPKHKYFDSLKLKYNKGDAVIAVGHPEISSSTSGFNNFSRYDGW